MANSEFIAKVRELKVHERALRAPLRSERTQVFPSLERLLGYLESAPADAELEVTRKKNGYILRIRR